MSEANDERAKRVLEKCEGYDEFIMMEDGDWYFWIANRGALSPWVLRVIVDELDRRSAANKECEQ